MQSKNWIDQLKWPDHGLLPAIARDYQTGKILMMAWMNTDALHATVDENRAVYWSRSRKKLWRKGEESGHIQVVHEIRVDCDRDTILLKVEQLGGIACHTGRQSCFFLKLENDEWNAIEPVLKSPTDIYGNK